MYEYVQTMNKKAWQVILLWLCVNSVFALLYLLHVLTEAEMLLLTTTESLADISVKLGFSSPYHFSSEFRRCHSVSPSVYRATARSSSYTAAPTPPA